MIQTILNKYYTECKNINTCKFLNTDVISRKHWPDYFADKLIHPFQNQPMTNFTSFHENVHQAFNSFIQDQKKLIQEGNFIKIDLHCHDHHSNVPDELIGRIMHVPETWLKTKKLIEILDKQEVDLITITNHNNADSCFELIQKGKDVLVGAEFTCKVPDYNISLHVLTYGFDEEQEKLLNTLRHNLYEFLRYCKDHEIPTIWAHPLYFYSPGGIPPMEFFDRMILVFERFEVINGQRDSWQNMLVKTWVESMTPDKLTQLAQETGIQPDLYCRSPFKKTFFAGSDSHSGIFAGTTGTYLRIDKLEERKKISTLSELAKEAILEGNSAVFGTYQTNEKLFVAFLDYFLQLARFKQDPGLMRILLHKGTYRDKLIALFASNAITELQYHSVTMKFIEVFHDAILGKKSFHPKKYLLPKSYRKILEEAASLSHAANEPGEKQLILINNSIQQVYQQLMDVFFKRLEDKISLAKLAGYAKNVTLEMLIQGIDLPADIRHYQHKPKKSADKSSKNIQLIRWLDGLPFPFLASNLILASRFTSTRVLYANRELLNEFGSNLQAFQHPKRILWLSDTFEDKNGVALVLQSMHQEIKAQNLPVDFLICSHTLEPDAHLFVTKPRMEFSTDFYPQQPVRIPDMMQIHQLFQQGEYDQVICSTEGFMGIAALYLKHAFSVKASFYLHTDWIQFAKDTTSFSHDASEKLRRLLRGFYHQFDKLFVLNTDHQKWLSGSEVEIPADKLFLTAHWVESYFVKKKAAKKELFGVSEDCPVLLFSGRLSKEKGILDFIQINKQLKTRLSSFKLVFAGTGPMEKTLKAELPDALFLGWVNHQALPDIYSSTDLLVLPSRFDTFSCSVLEAMSCGLPVIAYQTKGPKDIIQANVSGLLANDLDSMVNQITLYFQEKELQQSMRENCMIRAREFKKETILQNFMKDILSPVNNNG